MREWDDDVWFDVLDQVGLNTLAGVKAEGDGQEAELRQQVIEAAPLMVASSISKGTHGMSTNQKKRIKMRTFEKLGLRRKSVRTSKTRILALSAVAVVVFAAILGTNLGSVSAALKRVFSFVPGIGTVHQSLGNTDAYVLQRPFTKKYPGHFITVDGVLITPHSITVSMHGVTNGIITNVRFINEKGHSYDLSNASQGIGNQWEGQFSYQGPVTDFTQGTLVFVDRNKISIPVTLVKAPSVNAFDQLGPTDTQHGLTVAAVVTKIQGKARISFVSQHQQYYHVMSYGLDANMHPDIGVIGQNSNQTYPVTLASGFGSNTFLFTPSQGESSYDVQLPNVLVQVPGSTKVTLPIPKQGVMHLRRTVTLAGFPVTVTKIARGIQGANSVRVYLDMQYSPYSAESLLTFDVTGYKGAGGFSARLNSQTEAYEYLDLPVQPGQSVLHLTLWNGMAEIHGPWTFHIKVPQ